MSDRLKNRVAIITGSGRGIGRAIALGMAKEGAQVVTNDYDPGFAEAVAKEITDLGGKSIPFHCDVSDFEATRKLVQAAVDNFGRIDILVNNAGIMARKAIWDMTESDWDTMIAIHLKGSFNCIRHACGIMKEQKWGRIINTTSIGRLGVPESCHYGAAKAGIVGLTKGVALEVGSYGITCNAYGPGAATRMTASPEADARMRQRYEAGTISKEFYERTLHRAPPEAMPPLLIFLCTDEAAGINGQVFNIMVGREIRIYQEVARNSITAEGEGFWTIEKLTELVPKELFKGIQSKIAPFS